MSTLLPRTIWKALLSLALAPAVAARATSTPYPTGTHLVPDRPHPAVARIVVPEGNATSFGSGTLVDARDQFGLVVTNWHVVRDGTGDIEVIFPDGFRSKARALKVDRDWDLAALVIWRPPTPPVPIATAAPQPGDQLTICGYGQGQYRAATGRCTQYYAPKLDLPQHMVELDVEARQGDSGGPIFNERGELAGVLFGAGGGTTLGSFGGRVGSFLATLAPDIGRAADNALVQSPVAPNFEGAGLNDAVAPPREAAASQSETAVAADRRRVANPAAELWTPATISPQPAGPEGWRSAPAAAAPSPLAAAVLPASGANRTWGEHAKTVLAAVGVLALALQALRGALAAWSRPRPPIGCFV